MRSSPTFSVLMEINVVNQNINAVLYARVCRIFYARLMRVAPDYYEPIYYSKMICTDDGGNNSRV